MNNLPLICQCGCGEVIPPRPSHRRYTPRYILSHFLRLPQTREQSRVGRALQRVKPPADWPTPTGLCECGCGLPTSIAKWTLTKRGIYKGFPYRFRRGHAPAIRRHGPDHPNYRGDRHLDNEGYVLAYAPGHPHRKGRYVLEHRLVYEQAHGITLTPHDVIHHINGVRTDNRLENLVRTTQSVHMQMHPRPAPPRQSHEALSAAGKKGGKARQAMRHGKRSRTPPANG